MEDWRKAALCPVLLILLIVASSHVVSSAAEGCWKEDDHHLFCGNEDCRMTCKDHGHADGRCNWGGMLPRWPVCECLLANCQ